jgi:predicted short-subunit dehydrogenase-like oxidoreductase (DUF2520 family)
MAGAIVVGPGRMGLALGYALLDADAVQSLTVFGRRPEPPAHPLFMQGAARYVFGMEAPGRDTDAIFLAVPDHVVPELAHTLAAQGDAPDGCAAFLLSSSLSTDVLAPLHARGYELGSFHPLMSVTDSISGAERFDGSYIAGLGSPEAMAVARRLAGALGSTLLMIPASRRPLFDAAVATATHYLPALMDTAARLLEEVGVERHDAVAALVALTRGVLGAIEERGIEMSLGGPAARGDVEAVDLHLRVLPPDIRGMYALFGREVVRLAGAGLDAEVRQELEDRFEREIAAGA